MRRRWAKAGLARFPRVLHRLRLAKYVSLGWGEKELGIIGAFAQPDSACVDVGAHLGFYSCVLAKHAAAVLAVEPNPELARYLSHVCPSNVKVFPTALSDSAGATATLRIPSRAGGLEDAGLATIASQNRFAGSAVVAWREVPVATETLDNLCARHALVTVIKIDVEGHENAVVRGAVATIERCRPVFMIEVEARHNPHYRDLFAFFADRGYRAHYVDGSVWRGATASELAALQAGVSADARGRSPGAPAYVNNFFFVPAERVLPRR